MRNCSFDMHIHGLYLCRPGVKQEFTTRDTILKMRWFIINALIVVTLDQSEHRTPTVFQFLRMLMILGSME